MYNGSLGLSTEASVREAALTAELRLNDKGSTDLDRHLLSTDTR